MKGKSDNLKGDTASVYVVLPFFCRYIIMALTKITARLDRTRSDTLVFKDGNSLLSIGIVLLDDDGNHLIPSLTTPFTDLEGGGDVTVGTSEVEVIFTGTPTQNIRIQADEGNTGIIFLGKIGVLSDKTNDYIRLFAGDEITMPYNDATNGLFAISDTAAQTINKGTLL